MQQEAPRQLYAAKGERVTCHQQHTICSISRDVFVGEQTMDIFCDWQQPQPSRETTINRIRCAVCRGTWIRGSRGSFRLRFTEGWR